MGIDPGTNYMGYGVLEVCGREVRSVVLGDIDLHRMNDPYEKLRYIFERVGALVDEYRPREVALESPFFGENVQSMLKLGRAQGVAMAAALSRGIDVFEYAPMRIKQILNNFISNALKNTVQGHIEVYYETDTDGIRISVSDTGCGIPPDKPGMIFKRFEKVDSFAQGAGLGLSICKSIVEKMNGVITVDSTMGVGSTFTVELPCRTRPS